MLCKCSAEAAEEADGRFPFYSLSLLFWHCAFKCIWVNIHWSAGAYSPGIISNVYYNITKSDAFQVLFYQNSQLCLNAETCFLSSSLGELVKPCYLCWKLKRYFNIEKITPITFNQLHRVWASHPAWATTRWYY